MKKFPTLFKRGSDGKVHRWEIEVVMYSPASSVINTFHGVDGGAMVHTSELVKEGKNKGKKNETDHFTQAVSQAQSAWNKKVRLNYRETLDEEPLPIRPMLAHKFDPSGIWPLPAYVQPKYDGLRCIAEITAKGVILHSRGGKTYTVPRIQKALGTGVFAEGTILDGELYTHGYTRNQIGSMASNGSDLLDFIIYDAIIPDVNFDTRWSWLMDCNWIISKMDGVSLSQTRRANKKSDLEVFHAHFVEQGYEGTIIRNPEGLYKVGHRSRDLLKYKDFQDDEFKVISVQEDSQGHAVFVLETPCGKQFESVPKGTLVERKVWANHPDWFIGKMATVRYQNLWEGIPQIQHTVCVREVEDAP